MARASSGAASVRRGGAGAVIPTRAQPGAARMVSAIRIGLICSMSKREHRGNDIARGLRRVDGREASSRSPINRDHGALDRGDLPDFSGRSEEHTSELQSLMRISYAVFCLQKNITNTIVG